MISNTYQNTKVISDNHITIKKSRDGGYMGNSQNIDADTITGISDKILNYISEFKTCPGWISLEGRSSVYTYLSGFINA